MTVQYIQDILNEKWRGMRDPVHFYWIPHPKKFLYSVLPERISYWSLAYVQFYLKQRSAIMAMYSVSFGRKEGT